MSTPTAPQSPNFKHLKAIDPLLTRLGAKAEKYVFDAPEDALIKLRQLGEALARQAAAFVGLYTAPDASQLDLLNALRSRGVTDYEVSNLFHTIRKAGNKAVHDHEGTQREALNHLRLAWRLAVWFYRAFKDPAE